MRCVPLERLIRDRARPGRRGPATLGAALRLALVIAGAAAAYLALLALDDPAHAGERPTRPGPLGGVLDVVAAGPRSLADSGPSASDRTEPLPLIGRSDRAPLIAHDGAATARAGAPAADGPALTADGSALAGVIDGVTAPLSRPVPLVFALLDTVVADAPATASGLAGGVELPWPGAAGPGAAGPGAVWRDGGPGPSELTPGSPPESSGKRGPPPPAPSTVDGPAAVQSACCVVGPPATASRSSTAPASADRDLARADAPSSPPAPIGHGAYGAATIAGVGANPYPAVPPVAGWRAHVVPLVTIRLADAIRHGRSPAVPALPG